MKILFLSPRQANPPVSGAKLREYHLARALARCAELTHVSFAETGSGMNAADLPFCRRVISVPRPPRYGPDKIVRGLLGRWPLSVLNYTSGEMKQTLAPLLDKEPFDLVHLESIHLVAYLPLIRLRTQAPVVIDWHNIESELMYRYARTLPWSPRKIYANLTAARLAHLEKEMLGVCSGHIVCSARDGERVRAIVPNARIAVVENGVDTEFFANGTSEQTDRRRLVFVGSMDYHANVEAICSFARDVWPALRERFPEWRLTLVGSNPAPAVQALRAEKNVEVTGTVPDVRPYYHEAFASLVPLRTGGGTRLKILEAMAAGVPVVSTSLGAEGLSVSPGENILIADSDDLWLPLLASLSSDADKWNRIARAGRTLVEQRYDWRILGQSLTEIYAGWFHSAT